MADIKNLKPEEIWRNFDALTQVHVHQDILKKYRLSCSTSPRRLA